MNQLESVFKIRYFKMGITLVGVLCICDLDICIQVLVRYCLQIQMWRLRIFVLDFALKDKYLLL